MKKGANHILFASILLVVIVFGLYSTFTKPAPIETPVPKIAQLNMTVIGTECEECYKGLIELLTRSVRESSGSNVTEANMSKEDAKELIEKYNISKLPAIVITGDINDTYVERFEVRDDALIFEEFTPPYINVKKGKLEGVVEAKLITREGCDDCGYEISNLLHDLKKFPVYVQDVKEIAHDSAEGKALIKKYQVEKIPTIIFNQEAIKHAIEWIELGFTLENDSSLVMRDLIPPYVDVKEDERIEGLVNITFVYDSTCDECYNVLLQMESLSENFGVKFDKTKEYDIAKDDAIAERYDITKVPTSILSPSASAYSALDSRWHHVGHISVDGSYVWTDFSVLQETEYILYKDLKTGEITDGSLKRAEPKRLNITTK